MATLKDIATAIGVHPSTVSVVLNGKTTRIPVSDRTKLRIREAARRLNYEPNASARALATGRSGNLGFVLSDQITGGWGNAYFAAQLTGVEDRCRQLGYGLAVSRYNLTNLDQFVFPLKVRQRNVDGLVIAGDITVPVVRRFQEFGIPCVGIALSLEVADLVPSISADTVTQHMEVMRYAYRLGHRRVGLCAADTSRFRQVAETTRRRVERDPALAGAETHILALSRQADWLGGKEAYVRWAALPPDRRPTLIFGSDQCVIGFLKAMRSDGLRCPEDVSLISGVDTEVCGYFEPSLTTFAIDETGIGRRAVDLLMNHLDHNEPLGPKQSNLEPRFELIERESCKFYSQSKGE